MRSRAAKAAMIAELAGQTEAARIGRFYMDASRRMRAVYKERGLTPVAPMVVLAGLEGLSSLAAEVIVREGSIPASEKNAIAGYVMTGLHEVWTAVVQNFDSENYAAWRRELGDEHVRAVDGGPEDRQ